MFHTDYVRRKSLVFGGLFSKRTKFEEFLENLKPVIRNGNNSLGLPPLDPFISPEQSLNIHELGIKCVSA